MERLHQLGFERKHLIAAAISGAISITVLIFGVLGSFPDGGSPAPEAQRGDSFTIGADSSSPQRLEAKQGQQVKLDVNVDEPEKLVIEGYGLKLDVKPPAATISFTATAAGSYPITTLDDGQVLAELIVE